jgi:GntR family transcriptional repressor for pyruvate dehydrogenase complex
MSFSLTYVRILIKISPGLPPILNKKAKTNLFSRVEQNKVALDIIRQVREAILEGKLKAGDRLPPEKQLLVKFGVGKHTLREAVRALEAMGFLSIRKGYGGGAVVLEVDMNTTRDSIANFLHFQNVSVRNLSEVRKLVEPYLARLAAERLRQDGLEALDDCNQACREALLLGQSMSSHEIKFHRILADASGNPVLILILDFVNSVLTDSKRHLQPGPAFSQEVLAAHERILAAVRERDLERAEAEMRDHVCEVDNALEALRIEKEEGTKGGRKASGKSSRSLILKRRLSAGALRPGSKPVVKRTGGM